jgi:hypothetical protein
MAWKPRAKLHDWRKHLTPDEAKIIAASDIAKRALEALRLEYNEKFQRDRTIIVNRAIQRAKYEERKT